MEKLKIIFNGRPQGWRTGFLGLDNAVLTLGNFPNRIQKS